MNAMPGSSSSSSPVEGSMAVCAGVSIQQLSAVVEEALERQLQPVAERLRGGVREELQLFLDHFGKANPNAEALLPTGSPRVEADEFQRHVTSHEWTSRHMRGNLDNILPRGERFYDFEDSEDEGSASEETDTQEKRRPSRVHFLSRQSTSRPPAKTGRNSLSVWEPGGEPSPTPMGWRDAVKHMVHGSSAVRVVAVEARGDSLRTTSVTNLDGESEEVPCVAEVLTPPSSAREGGQSVISNHRLGREDSFVPTDLIAKKNSVVQRHAPSIGNLSEVYTRKQKPVWSRLKVKLHAVVKSSRFDHSVCFIILLNAVCIGLGTDYTARHPEREHSTYMLLLFALEFIFCVVFIAELALRLFVYKLRLFSMETWRWNVFDVTVVALQVLEIIMRHFAPSLLQGASNFSFMRVIRILRLVRVMRLIRILQLIKELRTLVHSILTSLKSLLWTCVLLFFMIYTIALYVTQMVTESRVHGSKHAGLTKYYGSVILSMRSFYQAITGGVDWQELVLPLEEEISPYISFLFCAYIAFATLAMLNVVTGVFVESVLSSAKVDRELFLINNARELFQSLEGGLKGQLTWDLFEAKLDSLPMQEFFRSIGVDRSEAKGLFRLLDLDNSGAISAEEFLSGCLRLNGNAKALDLALLIREFKHMEKRVYSHMGRMDRVFRPKAY